MAAILSHAVAGAGIAAGLRPRARVPARYWIFAIFCAVIPDFDILLVWMGTDYRGMWGHRGITHSIAFAAALAAALMILSWVFLLHIPRALVDLRSPNETTAAFEALAMSGAALLVANWSRARMSRSG